MDNDMDKPRRSSSVSIILEVLIISAIAGVVLFLLINFFETKALVVASTGSAINDRDQSKRLKSIDEKILELKHGVKKIGSALELLRNDSDFTEKESDIQVAGDTLAAIERILEFNTTELPQDRKDVRAEIKSAEDLRDEIRVKTFEDKLEAYESLVNGASAMLKTLETRYATPFTVPDKRFTSPTLRKSMIAENKNNLRIELAIQIGDNGFSQGTTLMFPMHTYISPVEVTNEPILGPPPDRTHTGKYVVILDFKNKLVEIDPTNKKLGSGLISCVATSLVGVDPLNLKQCKITCATTSLASLAIAGDSVLLFPPIYFDRANLNNGLRLEAAYPGNYVVSVVLHLA